MKRLGKTFVATSLLVASLIMGSTYAHADVYVRGYYRSDGTYVQPHYRSSPDGNPYNNYSFPGNLNPYTGKIAPGDPDTYLKNYYGSGDSGSSGSDTFSYSPPPSYAPPPPTSFPYSSLLSSSCPLNSSEKNGKCYCNEGYENYGGSCISYNLSCQLQYGFSSHGDKSYCYCNSGYEFNANKTACILSTQTDEQARLKAMVASLVEQVAALQAQLAAQTSGR